LWRILFVAAACIASGSARAAVTSYAVINPIDVCTVTKQTNGTTTTSCAPFGMNCTTNADGSANCGSAFNDPVAAVASPQAIANTPIGFVDQSTITNPSTGATTQNDVNITRAIWLQAGIDVVFLPMQQFISPTTCPGGVNCNTTPSGWPNWTATDYQTLHISQVTCSTTNVTSIVSPDLAALTNYTLPCGSPTSTVQVCPTCNPSLTQPLSVLYSDSRVMNMFFINSFADLSGITGQYNGLSWLNGNGIAIASNTFNSTLFDTLAHEGGHVLDLGHNTLGANSACTGKSNPYQLQNGCNLMAAGSVSGSLFRIIPQNSDCTKTSSNPASAGGELYDIGTGLCPTNPSVPQADQILLGTKNTTQQSTALLSNFLNPQQSVITAATAGGGTAAATTLTSSTTTTSTTFASPSGAINITVGPFDPVQPNNNGSNNSLNNNIIVAAVLTLGKDFNFDKPSFTCPAGQPGSPVFSCEFLNGNNGQGNINCIKPFAGTQPSIECLEIDFKVTEILNPPNPPTFIGCFNDSSTPVTINNVCTTTNTFSFSVVINNKLTGAVATLQDLQCTTPIPNQCLNLTYAFGDLHAVTTFFSPLTTKKGFSLTGNANSPDLTVPAVFIEPADLPSIAGLSSYPSIFIGSGNTLPLLDSNGNKTGILQACTDFGSGSCPPAQAPGCTGSGRCD
jgi:hypothetical protein